jgi:tetratricopeptide (TPR) repeat protein
MRPDDIPHVGVGQTRTGLESAMIGPAPALLVLGMHRSGTSCLGGMLQCAGFDAGAVQVWNEDNPRGNRELPGVMQLNDLVLETNGADWRHPPAHAVLQFGDVLRIARQQVVDDMTSSGRPWMIKDPRTLLTLPFWREGMADLRRIGIFRHPLQVALSLYYREQMPLFEGVALWQAYNTLLLDEYQRQSFPLVCFDLPREGFLAGVTTALRTECADLVKSATIDLDALPAFYSVEHVHHKDEEAIAEDSHAEALALHRQLCECAGMDVSAVRRRRISKINDFSRLLEADRAVEAGNTNRAIVQYRAAAATSPDPRAIWARIIKLMIEKDLAADLATACDEAIRRFPLDREFLMIRASTHRREGHLHEAMQVVARVLELYPATVQAWLRKGEWHCEIGDRGAGILALKHAIGLEPPGHFWAHAVLGDALIRLHCREEGDASFTRSLELAPSGDRARVHHRMSNALLADGDDGGALQHAEASATLSNEPHIHFDYARLLEKSGRGPDASIHIKIARERGVDSISLRTLLKQINE